mmetsp:Transcript_5606/g.10693  ORF Transcript_5606/g.10693 Transcript_5606/m.10693 type:complete len:228 (+) Transcript_5606:110-793(+)
MSCASNSLLFVTQTQFQTRKHPWVCFQGGPRACGAGLCVWELWAFVVVCAGGVGCCNKLCVSASAGASSFSEISSDGFSFSSLVCVPLKTPSSSSTLNSNPAKQSSSAGNATALVVTDILHISKLASILARREKFNRLQSGSNGGVVLRCSTWSQTIPSKNGWSLTEDQPLPSSPHPSLRLGSGSIKRVIRSTQMLLADFCQLMARTEPVNILSSVAPREKKSKEKE